MAPVLSAPAALVRSHDPDLFLATLFAPEAARETLFVLYAFNHELARAPVITSQPELALIRLAWWREVVEGVPHRHEVAEPLGALIKAGELDRASLVPLIDAREKEVAPDFPTLADWRAQLFATGGGLAVAAGRALGADAEPALRGFGAACRAAGLLSGIAFQARRGRVLLPGDLLAAHGLSPAAVAAAPEAPALAPVRRALAEEARAWLRDARARALPRAAVPAALPAVLAGRDLRTLGPRSGGRGVAARLAVLAAAVRGRI